MLSVIKLICIIQLKFILIQCLIPSLSVQKFDKKLIERKRQDTVEMCRIFTKETEKFNQYNYPKILPSQTGAMQINLRRSKRSLDPVKYVDNPRLNNENAKKVEKIVDTMYDEITEKGQPVTYSKNAIVTTKVESVSKMTSKNPRRFDFAPGSLDIGVDHSTKSPGQHSREDDNIAKNKWAKKWKHGIVPYFIDPQTYDVHLMEIMTTAFDYVEKVSCIRLQRLRERPTGTASLSQVEWLYITNPHGVRQCVHSNELKENKGVQVVVFGYDCMSMGEILHELMHLLGFSHEHTRPDRDQHISIMWDNIKTGYKKFFQLRTSDPLIHLPYDYTSIMHYPSRAFSKNGQMTIVTNPGIKIGQREALSEKDLEKIVMVYGDDCLERNREYLLKTCPTVVRSSAHDDAPRVDSSEIQNYFKDRLWPYGIVNFQIKNKAEFTIEELDNIQSVISHIEKETCIEFRDLSKEKDEETNVRDREETDQNKNDVDFHSYTNVTLPDQSTLMPFKDVVIKVMNLTETKINGEDALIGYPISDQEKKDDLNKDLENEIKSDTNSMPEKVISKRDVSRVSLDPPVSPSRRHAQNILTFKRSPELGCPCPSSGKPTSNMELSINTECFNSVNDLLHLFVHLLGLDHQHNMHDRDSHLHILWDQLTPEIKQDLQNKLPPAASVGFPYDYSSVMHYPWLQIKDGKTNVMYPIWNDGWAMGHWQGLSSVDVQKLNLLYFEQCQERKKHVAL